MLIGGGASVSAVARKLGIHRDAALRHWAKHVSSERKAALIAGPVPIAKLAAYAASEGESVLDQLKNIRTKLYRVFDSASEANDRNGASQLAGKLHENLQLVAKLTGELVRSTAPNVTNILLAPDVLELMNEIRMAVSPFPAARAAVVEALDRLESRALARVTNGTGAQAPAIQGEATHVD